MKRLPPLAAIEAFVQTARPGSVKAAAESLALSSPALTRRIQSLERHVGQPLFERRHQAVLLNPDGERLLAEVGPALDELGLAMERATGQGELMRLKLVGAAALRLLPADAAAAEAARAPSRSAYRHRHPAARARPARRRARRGDRAGARGRAAALLAPARHATGWSRSARGILPRVRARSPVPSSWPRRPCCSTATCPTRSITGARRSGCPASRAGGDRPFRFRPADPRRGGRRGSASPSCSKCISKARTIRGWSRLFDVAVESPYAYWFACRRAALSRRPVRIFHDWLIDELAAD